ncbi:MAG: Mannitol-1-phosphate 5-dehydrogenase [Planctomycetes bacterium ADurb.Bin401]|nr:MAG: Mannitol-1-phosphate 5-dehydrogenase [Planctomycetes bacterium ADurb.Bin401]
MLNHIFTGFGFGPIQAGLFVNEAYKSGNFSRIVISEVDQKLVDAVRANKGRYYINVAKSNGIEAFKIEGIEIYNPTNAEDRKEIVKALSQSTEICTSLPSVNFYDKGVAELIREGLSNAGNAIIYTAENNNHAAEILEQKVGSLENVQFLNTVIGKMSQVVTDKEEIQQKNVKTIVPGIDRAFLVEEFNKILVTKCHLPEFTPGIRVFIEKEDLLPFEEAKLYGHNAIHALLAYLGAQKGFKKMADLKNDKEIMQIARNAFINESGASLIKKYAHLKDELFTEAGYRAYAEDLLERMTNPYLDDTIERAARDPERKLGINDRIFGTMRLALENGIDPENMAKAAAAGVKYLAGLKKNDSMDGKAVLARLLNDVNNSAKLESLTTKYLNL